MVSHEAVQYARRWGRIRAHSKAYEIQNMHDGDRKSRARLILSHRTQSEWGAVEAGGALLGTIVRRSSCFSGEREALVQCEGDPSIAWATQNALEEARDRSKPASEKAAKRPKSSWELRCHRRAKPPVYKMCRPLLCAIDLSCTP